jgi:hypothetical protein
MGRAALKLAEQQEAFKRLKARNWDGATISVSMSEKHPEEMPAYPLGGYHRLESKDLVDGTELYTEDYDELDGSAIPRS